MAKKNVDKADMINVLRDNYMIYARSTIVERSLPFIDGYKPVQRRALYAMWELGLDKVSAKSARVVGDTMGKYHPHGDCFSTNTLMYLTNGKILTIGEAYALQKELEILAYDTKTKKIVPAIAHHFRIGQYTDKKYHIKLSNGGEIECTSNHPILLRNGVYVKAEDIKVGDKLYSKYLNLDDRPKVNSTLIQDIVGKYYFGKLNSNQVKHHIDGNVKNNSRDNLVVLTRDEHAKLHKDYLTGLDVGRQKMFNKGGEFREQTKQKNSFLFKSFNEEQGIRRFLYWIDKLRKLNVEITLENYEKLRKKDNEYGLEVYNLPKVERLIKKGYGSTFEDLISYKVESISDKYIKEQKSVQESVDIQVETCETNNHLSNYYISLLLDKFSLHELYEENIYEKYINKINTEKNKYSNIYFVTKEDFNIILQMYFKKYVFVTSVDIEHVKQEPMYDFTVDDYENMLIPVGKDGDYSLLCVHNSSIYGAMCQMADTYEGRNAAEIKAKGCFGKAWSTVSIPAAAYRYCVTGDTLVSTNKGIYPIKDLEQFSIDEDIDIYVKGHSTKNYHASKFFNSGSHKVITVKLLNGLEITGTYNHPIMVYERGDFYWKLLSNLTTKDIVVLSKNFTNLFGENNNLKEAYVLGNYYSDESFIEGLSQNVLNGSEEYLSVFFSTLFKKAKSVNKSGNDGFCLESSNMKLLKQLQIILQQNYGISSYLSTVDMVSKLELFGSDYKSFKDYILLNKRIELSTNLSHETVGVKEVIYENEEQVVYSIRVDDESHSFCANGFINHNTEAKLTKCISECAFDGINNDAVDFIDNHDNTLQEPVLLPIKFPNIIVNTSSGVACGIRTYIPCYTLKNACEATIGLLNGKIIDCEGLALALDAPDFQTGGIINMSFEQKMDLVKTGITKGIYLTGRYKVNKQEMTIYELPYNTSCEKVTSQIEDCIKERKISGITRVVNGADKDGLGVVVFLQKGFEAEDIFKYLCAFTDVQTRMSFQTKFINIDSKTKSLNYKEVGIFELLNDYWIPWRIETIRRIKRYKLSKLQIDKHRAEAWIKIGDDIPTYVDILVHNMREDAKRIHIEKYGLDEEQEEYLLHHNVDGITLDGVLRAKNKLNDILREENEYTIFIEDEDAIKKYIISELKDVVKKYSIPRKSSSEEFGTLVHLTKEEATAIPDEEVWIGITEKCKLKKASSEKDAENFCSKVEENDAIWKIYPMNNKDKLIVLTTAGFIYKVPVHSLDSSTRTNFKDSVWRFVNKDAKDRHKELEGRSDTFYIAPFGDGKNGFNIVYNKGYIKKIRFDAYQSRSIYRDQFPEYNENGFVVPYDRLLCITNQNRAKIVDLTYMYDSEKATKGNTLYRFSKLKDGEEIMCVLPLDKISECLTDEMIIYYTKRYFVRIRRNELQIAFDKYVSEHKKDESTEEDTIVDSLDGNENIE